MPGQLTARIAVVESPRRLAIREVGIPEIGDDDGLLEIEVNGICGSDAEFYEGVMGNAFPMTIGHEPVGRVMSLGANARRRWGVSVGARVVVHSAIRCGDCANCAAGRDCRSTSYGMLPPDLSPGLWGGIATHLYLSPLATVVPLADGVSTADAAFHNPLANGFEWAGEAGQIGESSRVVVLGAGPRGFACALVALYLGAEQVVMVGLDRDRGRLALATRMGVHDGIVVAAEDPNELRDQLAGITVAIDTTPHSIPAVRQALQVLEPDGRLVVAGLKGPGRAVDIEIDYMVRNRLAIVAPWSKTEKSLRRAVEAIESGSLPLDLIPSRAYPLIEAATAIESLADADVSRPLHVRVEPAL